MPAPRTVLNCHRSPPMSRAQSRMAHTTTESWEGHTMKHLAALALAATLAVTGTATANALNADNPGARQAHETKLLGDSYNFAEPHTFDDGARLAHEDKLRGDSY